MNQPQLENLFVCIGAQKAGTSWLFSVLSQDDRFKFCPHVKEIHYFDHVHCKSPLLNQWRAHHLIQMVERRGLSLKTIMAGFLSGEEDNFLKNRKYKIKGNFFAAKKFLELSGTVDDAWYTAMLRTNEKQSYSMDITPDYAVIGENGFKHMDKLAKNLKLLFILRDPVERAWSGLLQGKKKHKGGVKEFLEQNIHNIDLLFNLCTTGKDILPRSNYAKTLSELEQLGLLDRTLIKFYDDIMEKPKEFILDVYKFLDLPVDISSEFEVLLKNKVYGTVGKSEMPEELRERLVEFYRPFNFALSKYCDVPDSWNA